jgi:hypothetical protein
MAETLKTVAGHVYAAVQSEAVIEQGLSSSNV